MLRSFFSTLNGRLVLLLFLALVPASILAFSTAVLDQQTALEEARSTVTLLNQLAASSQEQLLARARQLLITLSYLPEIRHGDPSVCHALLSGLLEQHTLYINFGVAELDGNVRCSALPLTTPVNIADRPYFQRVLETRDFAIGDYQVGRVTGKASLNFGYPMFDETGELQEIVVAAIDLAQVNALVAASPVPEGAAITVLDRNGTILARWPNSEAWVGQSVPDTPIVAAILARHSEGLVEAAGVDGIKRLYAFRPIAGPSEASLYVSIGIPSEVVFAKANQNLVHQLIGLGVVALFAAAALTIGSKVLILRAYNVLLRTTERLGKGDLSARTKLTFGPSEVRRLARSFDEMASTLQQRQIERSQAAEALQRYAQRLSVLHSIDIAILRAQTLEATIQPVLEFLAELTLAFRVSVTLFDLGAEEGVVLAVHSHNQTQWPSGTTFPLAMFSKPFLEGLRMGVTQMVEDTLVVSEPSQAIEALQAEGFRSYACIPLLVQEELVGSLSLITQSPRAFIPDHLGVAREVADQLAIAIHQVRLRERIQRHAAELEQRVLDRTAELDWAKRRVETILNHSSDAIILAGPDGVIEQTNSGFDDLFGYEPDAVFGSSLTTLVDADSVETLRQALNAVVQGSQRRRIEVMCRRKTGTVLAADMLLAPLSVGHHEHPNVICSVRDITEHKQMEEGLRRALENERELYELKSRFVSMVSHEFRNPLTTILSSSHLLKQYRDRLSEERQIGHLDKIETQVRRLTDLLNDILTLNKAEAVGLDFNPIPLDLETFCRDQAEEIQVVTETAHPIVFSTNGVCAGFVGDERLLRQMVTNLLTNAVKYSLQGGQVEFTLRCEDEQAVICVKDEGLGIPEEDQQHLFEPFHRARNVGGISGTGLGLPIVKRAVEAHSGNITCESEVGAGTTFTIRLPLISKMRVGSIELESLQSPYKHPTKN